MRWKIAALVLGFWTAIGAVTASQLYLEFRLEGREMAWGQVLVEQAAQWYSWAAATPLVIWLARRVRIAHPRRAVTVAAHALASVALACAIIAVYAAVVFWTERPGQPPWPFW